jgi:hypothetical protein
LGRHRGEGRGWQKIARIAMVAMIAELKTKDLPQIYVDDNSSEKVEFGSQK